MKQVVKLGEVDYFGQEAIAYREMYPNNVWKFVIVIKETQDRFVLMTY